VLFKVRPWTGNDGLQLLRVGAEWFEPEFQTSFNQWRQSEFKVGGDKGVGGGVPLRSGNTPTRKESGRGQICCFMISKWRILVNSEVLNLKFFFILSFLSGVWVDSVANFGFSSKTMNKRHH